MTIVQPGMRALSGIALFLAALTSSGCSTYHAYYARFHAPQYVVTTDFFSEAPQQVAVLPFASRSMNSQGLANAETCRRVFYRQFSILPFQDLELTACDHALRRRHDGGDHTWRGIVSAIRHLDALGMTSILDMHTLVTGDPLKRQDLSQLVEVTRSELPTDGYVIGIVRSYGRVYAVVFSTISVSARVEMRSSATGKLLWRGQQDNRNFAFPLSFNPLMIPFRLYDVWRKSRNYVINSLAYAVSGDLVDTIPYVAEPSNAFVRIDRKKAPYYHRRRVLMFMPSGRLPRDAVLQFLAEENGWYKAFHSTDGEVWVLKKHAAVVTQPIDDGTEDTRIDMDRGYNQLNAAHSDIQRNGLSVPSAD